MLTCSITREGLHRGSHNRIESTSPRIELIKEVYGVLSTFHQTESYTVVPVLLRCGHQRSEATHFQIARVPVEFRVGIRPR